MIKPFIHKIKFKKITQLKKFLNKFKEYQKMTKKAFTEL